MLVILVFYLFWLSDATDLRIPKGYEIIERENSDSFMLNNTHLCVLNSDQIEEFKYKIYNASKKDTGLKNFISGLKTELVLCFFTNDQIYSLFHIGNSSILFNLNNGEFELFDNKFDLLAFDYQSSLIYAYNGSALFSFTLLQFLSAIETENNNFYRTYENVGEGWSDLMAVNEQVFYIYDGNVYLYSRNGSEKVSWTNTKKFSYILAPISKSMRKENTTSIKMPENQTFFIIYSLISVMFITSFSLLMYYFKNKKDFHKAHCILC